MPVFDCTVMFVQKYCLPTQATALWAENPAKFLTEEIMGAQNFNFGPKMWDFQPKILYFCKKKFSNLQKFSRQAIAPLFLLP